MNYDNRKGLSVEQVRWAASHDWYVSTTTTGNFGAPVHVVNVLETGVQFHADGTKTQYSTPLSFDNYQALRAWAGY